MVNLPPTRRPVGTLPHLAGGRRFTGYVRWRTESAAKPTHDEVRPGRGDFRRASTRRTRIGGRGDGRSIAGPRSTKEISMLYTIVVVLLILWALGLVTSYTMGGLIHILLVVAIVVVLLRVISGRKAL
jgi:hypothetical protein